MSATAFSFRSKPMPIRPARTDARSVVPEPHVGSRTVPPSGQHARTSRPSSASGFCVGQPTRSLAEMNVSGNVLQIFGQLTEVGNDPWTFSSVRSPTLLFSVVQFSGN